LFVEKLGLESLNLTNVYPNNNKNNNKNNKVKSKPLELFELAGKKKTENPSTPCHASSYGPERIAINNKTENPSSPYPRPLY
jgi:hypothetical protein